MFPESSRITTWGTSHSPKIPPQNGVIGNGPNTVSESAVPDTQLSEFRSGPGKPKKKGQFMNFSQGRSGTKVQCESCLFSQGKTPEFTKMGEIHELFVLALSLVWFAGATPDEFLGPHRVPGRELSEFLSAYYVCPKAKSPSFVANPTEFAVKLSEAQ